MPTRHRHVTDTFLTRFLTRFLTVIVCCTAVYVPHGGHVQVGAVHDGK